MILVITNYAFTSYTEIVDVSKCSPSASSANMERTCTDSRKLSQLEAPKIMGLGEERLRLRFKDVHFLGTKYLFVKFLGCTPLKNNMSPKKEPLQKKRLVFQPPYFWGHVGVRGCITIHFPRDSPKDPLLNLTIFTNTGLWIRTSFSCVNTPPLLAKNDIIGGGLLSLTTVSGG